MEVYSMLNGNAAVLPRKQKSGMKTVGDQRENVISLVWGR